MPQHRITIDGTGFVTEAIAERLRGLPSGNKAFLDVVMSTVAFANELARRLPVSSPHVTPEEKQRVIALALLVRLVEVLESMIILASHGVRQELQTLFRVFLDAYFLLANVCSDPGFLAVYFRTDEPERLKLLNAAAQQEHELFAAINEYNTEAVRTSLGQRIREEAIQTFNSYAYAKNVGCEHVYDSMYRLSSPSVHSGPRCLANYIQTDEEGNVMKVLHRGDIETVHRALYDTEWFMLKALSGVCELFAVSGLERITEFETALEVAMVRHENPNFCLPTDIKPAGSVPLA